MKDLTAIEKHELAEDITFRLEEIADDLKGVEGLEDIRQMVLDTIEENTAIEEEFSKIAEQDWRENEAWLIRQYERAAMLF